VEDRPVEKKTKALPGHRNILGLATIPTFLVMVPSLATDYHPWRFSQLGLRPSLVRTLPCEGHILDHPWQASILDHPLQASILDHPWHYYRPWLETILGIETIPWSDDHP
jgi:hypothetical protein